MQFCRMGRTEMNEQNEQNEKHKKDPIQQTFTYSKSAIETLEQGVKYVQS